MKISVVMPSFLDRKSNSSLGMNQLFIRAVDSFIKQPIKEKELIVVSDGCEETNRIIKDRYKSELGTHLLKLIELPEHFGLKGITRQKGIDSASGDAICFLDTDDYFLPSHLISIQSFDVNKFDWVYFNYYVRPDREKNINVLHDTKFEVESMCNASYAWRKELEVSWENCDGIRDNKLFIAKLFNFPKVKKIYGIGYVVTNVQYVKI